MTELQLSVSNKVERYNEYRLWNMDLQVSALVSRLLVKYQTYARVWPSQKKYEPFEKISVQLGVWAVKK